MKKAFVAFSFLTIFLIYGLEVVASEVKIPEDFLTHHKAAQRYKECADRFLTLGKQLKENNFVTGLRRTKNSEAILFDVGARVIYKELVESSAEGKLAFDFSRGIVSDYLSGIGIQCCSSGTTDQELIEFMQLNKEVDSEMAQMFLPAVYTLIYIQEIGKE